MNLIIAEANLSKSSADITAAVTAINNVRTDNDDVFGVKCNNIPAFIPVAICQLKPYWKRYI